MILNCPYTLCTHIVLAMPHKKQKNNIDNNRGRTAWQMVCRQCWPRYYVIRLKVKREGSIFIKISSSNYLNKSRHRSPYVSVREALSRGVKGYSVLQTEFKDILLFGEDSINDQEPAADPVTTGNDWHDSVTATVRAAAPNPSHDPIVLPFVDVIGLVFRRF